MEIRHSTVDKKQTVEANRSQRRYWMQNSPSVADAGAAKPIVTATISDAVKRASPLACTAHTALRANAGARTIRIWS